MDTPRDDGQLEASQLAASTMVSDTIGQVLSHVHSERRPPRPSSPSSPSARPSSRPNASRPASRSSRPDSSTSSNGLQERMSRYREKRLSTPTPVPRALSQTYVDGKPLIYWMRCAEAEEVIARAHVSDTEDAVREAIGVESVLSLESMRRALIRSKVRTDNEAQSSKDTQQRWKQLRHRVKSDEEEGRIVLYLVEDRAFREIASDERQRRIRLATAARNRSSAQSPTGKVRVSVEGQLAECLRRLQISVKEPTIAPSLVSTNITMVQLLTIQRIGRAYLLRRGPIRRAILPYNGLDAVIHDLEEKRKQAFPLLPPRSFVEQSTGHAKLPPIAGSPARSPNQARPLYDRKIANDQLAIQRVARERRLAKINQSAISSQMKDSVAERRRCDEIKRQQEEHARERVTIREQARVASRREATREKASKFSKEVGRLRELDQREVDEVELHISLRMRVMGESRLEALKKTLVEVPGAARVASMSSSLSLSKAERQSGQDGKLNHK